MSDEIEDLVIETGVDSLMNYLAENGKASCSEIAEEIGVDKERVENWGNALAQQDLVEKHHTLTSGLVLEYSKKNLEEAGRKKAEIESEIDEQSDEVESDLSDKGDQVELTRLRLIDKKDSLEEKEKEKAVEETVDKLENLETKIDRSLENDKLDYETLKIISEIEKVLQQVEKLLEEKLTDEQGEKLGKKTEEAVSEVEGAIQRADQKGDVEVDQEDIRKKMKAVQKLEQSIEKARGQHYKTSNEGIVSKLKALLPVKKHSSDTNNTVETSDPVDKEIEEDKKIRKQEVPEETYQELVDENRVTEVMRKISLIDEPDYKSILEAERYSKDREQLTSYLEERVNDA